MVFSSPIFLYVFLPLVLAVYHGAPRTWRNGVLLSAGVLFYTWGEKGYIILMLASSLGSFLAGRWIESRRSRRLLIASVAANLATLVVFKYANFIVDNLNVITSSIGFAPRHLKPIHLPIGISFFTFEAISYLIDVYRGTCRAERHFTRFLMYMTLFPHLIAGPVVRYGDLAPSLAQRGVADSGFADGIRRFVVGLAKKMLLANPLASVADQIFGLAPGHLAASAAWLGLACYSLQIYFDFSGYSDMAIGLGKMFGFEFVENFNYPYVADSVTDFWRRWHISLSTWFRDYVYIPMGGNRAGPTRLGINLVVVFVLCGLWHGASWTFLIWGLYHGVFLVAERAGIGRLLAKSPTILRRSYTLAAVAGGWVFFRCDTLGHSLAYFESLMNGQGIRDISAYWNGILVVVLPAALVGCCPFVRIVNLHWDRLAMAARPIQVIREFAVVAFVTVLFVASAAQLAAGTYNPFIYFRF
jgi:alginate O-acetyltransferase complex protein AlgI